MTGKGFIFFTAFLVSALLYFVQPLSLEAGEYSEGRVRLVIHENTGRFSLFFLTDPEQPRYDAFFSHQDPRTSFLAVYYNDRIFRLGESMRFRIVNDTQGANPAVVFVSPFLRVRKEFSFIKTADSTDINGIKITIKIENTSSTQASVGLRMLLDTSLGEGRGRVPFFAGKQAITDETVVEGSSGEEIWLSRSDRLSLMGSISDPEDGRAPDFIHFANWKKMNDVPWKAAYNKGRNFHTPPYSIGDSAVCYYYEPGVLQPTEAFTYSVFLAEEGSSGFNGFKSSEPEIVIISPSREANLQRMYDLLERLDRYIDGEIEIGAEELTSLEREVSGLKAFYGLR